jgi:hypothetical protein
MPSDVQPAELAALLEYAERPRVDDWSLRAALTRYAQPQPQRVGDLLELVRRIDSATTASRARIEAEGAQLWAAVQADDPSTGDQLVGLLRAAEEIDRLGDVLSSWAADTTRDRPDSAVDAVITDVAHHLDDLGIPREERRPPRRARG